MAGPLPEAKLAVEVAAINPPKPLGIGVLIDGRPVAFVSLQNFKEVARKLEEMEAARENR